MPCNTEHMEPAVRERQLCEATQHLVYVRGAMHQPIPKDLAKDAANIYGGGEKRVVDLCKLLSMLNEEQFDRIVYNGRNPQARKLADWWDDHRKEDWKRVEIEAKDKTFDKVLAYVRQLEQVGYSIEDIAPQVASVTGFYVGDG